MPMPTAPGATVRDVARDLTLQALEGTIVGSLVNYKPEQIGEFVGKIYTAVLKAVDAAERP